jgi:succinate dehydrogenase / fumarate reductase cytochrome b subunit
MIGPYYRPQLTSVLSITHRATGVFLTLVAAPLLIWWLAAVSNGPQQYVSMTSCFSGLLGKLLLAACLFSLSFHFFNGIRHLIWDTGRMLDIEDAYRSGWLALAGSIIVTAILMVVAL